MLRSIGAAIACVIALGACAKEAPKATPKPTSSSVDMKKLQRESSKSVPSHLTIDATGDISVHYEADTDLRIVTFDPGARFAAQQLLSVGLEDFKDLPDDAKIRAYVDLVGFGVSAGKYTIPAAAVGKANSNPAASGGLETARALSKAYLAYYRFDPETKKASSALEFSKVLEPCSLEVGEKARSGELSCSKLADASGKTIELTMKWKAKE